MWPVLLKVGDWSFYSLGFFLFLGFFLAAFAIWKQARAGGLSQERVFDTLFLTTFLAIIIGRLAFVIASPDTFSQDYVRIILFTKYPGLSLPATILAAITLSGLLARSFSLPVLWLWDILALAGGLFAVFASTGCFLDGCFKQAPFFPLGIALFALVLVAAILFVGWKFAKVADLSAIASRRGLFFLCYLIFQLVSLLMTKWFNQNFWQEVGYGLTLFLVVGILGLRYKELFIYFYRAVSHKRSFAS